MHLLLSLGGEKMFSLVFIWVLVMLCVLVVAACDMAARMQYVDALEPIGDAYDDRSDQKSDALTSVIVLNAIAAVMWTVVIMIGSEVSRGSSSTVIAFWVAAGASTLYSLFLLFRIVRWLWLCSTNKKIRQAGAHRSS
jgi:HAMP domain-containing protein